METQYRYKFYKSPEFPFLPSMGLRHIFQGFEAKEEELGFIGMLTIDEAVWGFLLLAGVLGIFLGKRFL